MKCPYCNYEMEDGSKVCAACGQAVNVEDTEQMAAVQTPETAEVESAPAGEPKKGKKWLIPAAAAAVAVAGGAIWMSSQVDPKDAVIGAFKSIVAEDQIQPAEEIFGISEIVKKINTENSEVSLKLAFEDSSAEELAMLTSGGVEVTAWNDLENKKFAMDMGLDYADMDLATLKIYLDENQIAAAVPELSDKSFVIRYNEGLEEQIANSPFASSVLETEGIDISGLDDYMNNYMSMLEGGNTLFNIEALWNRYKEGSQAIENLKAAMTVEKIDKKEFTVDGTAQNCKGYHAVVSKDALMQFVKTTKDFFVSDVTLKRDMVSYLDMLFSLYGEEFFASLEVENAEAAQGMIWENLETQLNDAISRLETAAGDVSMNVYVTKAGKMAGFDFDTVLTNGEEPLKIYGDAAFDGGYHMLANMDTTVNCEVGGETFTLIMNTDGVYEAGNTSIFGTDITVTHGEESFVITYDEDYQIADGTYTAVMDWTINDVSQIKVTMDGFVENLVKGESFDMYFDSLKMETSLISEEEDYIELSGHYKVGPLETAIEAPAGKTFDVLAGTEEEYSTVAVEMYGNVMGLMMQLHQ